MSLRVLRRLTLPSMLVILAWAASAAPPTPNLPQLLVPPHGDSVSIESEPGPLIVPGRSTIPDSLVRTPQKFAREQLALGRQLERDGTLQVAMMAYANAVRADTTLEGANYYLARVFMHIGRPVDAELLLRRELRHHPDDRDASRELGVALSALGRHREAITRLRGLTRLDPSNDEHWYALGLAYANANRLREAEAPLRRAIALSPNRALEHRDLGVVLGSLHRTREARQEYYRALDLDSRDASVWLNLGNLEARAGRADSALGAYREAERRDSTYDLAYEGQLKTLERLERRDQIADLYLRWVTVHPLDDDLRLRAVRHLAALDRRDRALEIGRDGVRADGGSPVKHMILGMSLAAYGRNREALAELRRAEALYRGNEDRQRVRQLIASMRQSAPDSLREMFRADSVSHARPR